MANGNMCFRIVLKIEFNLFPDWKCITEQYSQATLDYGECLRLLEETVEPSNRRLASTHYNIGVACGYNNAFDDAISHYRSAIKIIEQKIAELQGMVDKTRDKSDEVKEPESDDPVELAKKELDELQSLIPDIQVKVNDQLFMSQNTVITWSIYMCTPQKGSPIL